MLDSTDYKALETQLAECHELSAVTSTLAEAMRERLHADGVTVVLRDGPYCYYCDENAVGPLWKGKRFPLERCISGWAMLNRVPVSIADIYADPRVPGDAYRPTFVKSLAMTPIREASPLGALGAYWADRHYATDDELDDLAAFARLAEPALVRTIPELARAAS
jgi:GAF domain-containing protein